MQYPDNAPFSESTVLGMIRHDEERLVTLLPSLIQFQGNLQKSILPV